MTAAQPEVARILLIEDSEDDAELLVAELKKLGRPIEVRRIETAAEMEAALAESIWDLVISDHRLPRFDSIRAFNLLRRSRLDIPFVIMSGTMPEEAAATVMSLGAHDFIDKSKPARLVPVIERELRQSRLRREKQLVEESLRRLTYRDALTGLPNGRMLVERIDEHLDHRPTGSAPAMLIVLNLDRFRRINESFGHEAGDRVLQEVARRLTDFVGEQGEVARIGQDKFGIYVRRVDGPADALATAQATTAAFALPFNVAGEDTFVTCSGGFSLYPDDASDPASLVQRAESAMFEARRSSAGTLLRYDGDPARRLGPLLRLENALRQAVSRNELHLLYQPQVHLGTSTVDCCEALIRWRHPQLGTLSPDKFIPLADEIGLIQEIGNWVLLEAARQNRRWHDGGQSQLIIAVNVSAVQFRRPSFASDVGLALAYAGLEPSRLGIEITETVLMEDAESTTRMLTRLKDMGVRISVDDFGTGYSSLSYLKRFPLDELKIDRSFVATMHEDADSLAIVRTIIALAKTLKLDVVAEGVETNAQGDLLRAMGCDRAQGFLFSRPRDAEDALSETTLSGVRGALQSGDSP
jgi:diguanylate cyclase (GGDEF)-like protein